MPGVKIVSVGRGIPDRKVSNYELEKYIDTNDDWISSRTGIKNRFVSTGESTLDLAYKASLDAIKRAEISNDSIDLIIVATVTPDKFTPSVACMLQAKLGLQDKSIMAFDINAACTGFIYALKIADQLIKGNQSKCALVLGAEVLSKVTNWNDRSTCVLFGDGAGAAILKESKENNLLCNIAYSKPDEEGFLNIDAITINNLFYKSEGKSYITMNGREVFKFAVSHIRDAIFEVVHKTGVSLDEIKYFVPHQANYRIIKNVACELNIDINRFFVNIHEYANTSSASIPIALSEMCEKGLLSNGDYILLVGFGGGLTWGASLIKWEN